MAIVDPAVGTSLSPARIISIQPGGGFCLTLELAWGRLRRAWLRRFRPGYVRRMQGLRQGECPSCPHDIIDGRDLKPYRNVCGYFFPDQHDPFQRRLILPFARAGRAELVCFSLLALAACAVFSVAAIWHWIFYVPLAAAIVFWMFVISFFRDPERPVPQDVTALVSPADGRVTHVDEVEDADFPGARALRVSIFLSVFNVHVNRMPRTCRVLDVRYFPGCFLDARHKECAVRNEQLWLDLAEAGTQRLIRVKQISGAIARRIVCWVKRGETLQRGERFGMIKFGSRTEVLIAADAVQQVQVKVGDMVKGASTILLHVK
jgi:phosphatidylserine decarboxylase